MKTILITGAGGFIGAYLMNNIKVKGCRVIGLDTRKSAKIKKLDVTETKSLNRYLVSKKPSIIIHCAAIKDLKECESDKKLSFVTNVLSTENIVNYAKKFHSKVIYISSDVVFNGKTGKYKPNDLTNPINWYGKTKVFSEILVKGLPNSTIVRTSLVIGALNEIYKNKLTTELKQNQLKNQTLLPQFIYQKLKNNKFVYLSSQNISNPTPIELLAISINEIINKKITGILHIAGPDVVSRYEFGLKIASLFNFDKNLIKKFNIDNSGLRPRNISMDVNSSFNILEINKKPWELNNYLPFLMKES